MSARFGKKRMLDLVDIRDRLMDASDQLDEGIIPVVEIARRKVILERAEAVRELVYEAMCDVDRLIDDD